MDKTIHFRLNETDFRILLKEEILALDWIRNVAGLKGTKEGCREGDCGACLVMLGGPSSKGVMEWQAVTSCTLALGELDGRHLVTIEGLAAAGLTPVMQAMLDEGASQCGFCSPGIVLALTNFLVEGKKIDPVAAMVAVEGNLCRCTGYGSIRRAASRLAADFTSLPANLDERLDFLGRCGVLPPSLANLMKTPPDREHRAVKNDVNQSVGPTVIGGGTDFFVRNPDPLPGLTTSFTDTDPSSRKIRIIDKKGEKYLELGCAVTEREFFSSALVNGAVPGLENFARDIASLPVRNRATLAGNIANASPIADMTSILIALGATIILEKKKQSREILLENFFVAYKKTALEEGEKIASILFPAAPVRFNFEKVARRARLDIAGVNTAIGVSLDKEGKILHVRYSAGGIAPVPLRLKALELLMEGRKPDAALARAAGTLARNSGTPISDVRGSTEYRKCLMERLVWAHFMRLWPELKLEEELLQ